MGNISFCIKKSTQTLDTIKRQLSPLSPSQCSPNSFFKFESECCICLDNKPNVLLLPCLHINMCKYCVNTSLKKNVCPVCQQNVTSFNLVI